MASRRCAAWLGRSHSTPHARHTTYTHIASSASAALGRHPRGTAPCWWQSAPSVIAPKHWGCISSVVAHFNSSTVVLPASRHPHSTEADAPGQAASPWSASPSTCVLACPRVYLSACQLDCKPACLPAASLTASLSLACPHYTPNCIVEARPVACLLLTWGQTCSSATPRSGVLTGGLTFPRISPHNSMAPVHCKAACKSHAARRNSQVTSHYRLSPLTRPERPAISAGVDTGCSARDAASAAVPRTAIAWLVLEALLGSTRAVLFVHKPCTSNKATFARGYVGPWLLPGGPAWLLPGSGRH
jgi:hypothetical protein